MPIPHAQVAANIQEIMRKNNLDVVTFAWPAFYKVTDRERMKAQFQADLSHSLKALGLLISYGSTVVLVGKDYPFAKVKV